MIRYEDVDKYVEARDRVVRCAMVVVDRMNYETGNDFNEMIRGDEAAMTALEDAVRDLRSLHADRGVRNPGTPGQQEPDAEPEHGEAVHPGGQS